MTAKVKNLMNELVKRETLEQGGDDAYNELDEEYVVCKEIYPR